MKMVKFRVIGWFRGRYAMFHYLLARVIVSVFAGLAMFVLNAGLNFRQL